MSQIRGRNTKPEIALRKALWARGLRYRVHYNLPGKPDLAFVGKKIAVFVDGCFWHGCQKHCINPKTNSEFWTKKIQGNIARDRNNDDRLQQAGWRVLRYWEHEIKDCLNDAVDQIFNIVVSERRNAP